MTDLVVLASVENAATEQSFRESRYTLFVRRGEVGDDDLPLIVEALTIKEEILNHKLGVTVLPWQVVGTSKDWTGPACDWTDLIDDVTEPIDQSVPYETHLALRMMELVGRMSPAAAALFTKAASTLFPVKTTVFGAEPL